MPRRASRLSEAKTWLAPHRRLVDYHCSRTAPSADEQHQAALAIPQQKIYRWQKQALPDEADLQSVASSRTKPLSSDEENQNRG